MAAGVVAIGGEVGILLSSSGGVGAGDGGIDL
jgi:hypothetical protein